MSKYLEFSVVLENAEATAALGGTLALWARPGLLISLVGELGAGKSVLARAFVSALFRPGGESDVPSPSYPMLVAYEDTRLLVFHADLYRLDNSAEIAELGIPDLLRSHCGIVEWGDKLPPMPTADLLTIRLSGSGSSRTAVLAARGAWVQVLQRNAELEDFLRIVPFSLESRRFYEGDASARRYEKVSSGGKELLLMDMAQRPDGPPVRDGRTYSAIAHLAENMTTVMAVNQQLRKMGYSAPATERCDLGRGFALIEYLGENVYGRMMLAGADMRLPMETAAALLADMASRDWPASALTPDGKQIEMAAYDREALLIEVDLLPSWFIPHSRGVVPSPPSMTTFAAAWDKLMPLVQPDKRVWTLRDYHSPNLIWLPDREGIERTGLIDTQDAVLGHPAYDLVSLAQDARVDMNEEMQKHILAHYCDLRERQGHFDRKSFLASYAVLGAQRATKILGIFARLYMRDGKRGYLRHIPRVAGYLRRNLSHPVLAELKDWYERHAPEALGEPG